MFDFTLSSGTDEYSPLTLAYVGDAVYEIFVRTKLCEDGNSPVNKLFKKSTHFVSAYAQNDIIHKLMDKLTDDEIKIFKRGRNAKSYTKAKNADILTYRHATGFETLVGYLFLSKNFDRLNEILELSFEIANQKHE